MKKITAIFFLVIFSFNNFGYKLVYQYFIQQSDVKLELVLDKENYNDDDLIHIKQPTNLPYYNNSKTFQRVNGEVKIEGVTYKYVKCRIYNDSLELLCIAHKTRMSIENSKEQFSKLVNDFQQSDSKKKTGDSQKTIKGFATEFMVLSCTKMQVPLSSSDASFYLRNPSLPLHYRLQADRPPIGSALHSA